LRVIVGIKRSKTLGQMLVQSLFLLKLLAPFALQPRFRRVILCLFGVLLGFLKVLRDTGDFTLLDVFRRAINGCYPA
jgi:hypothetical protein